jgi:hypothetical protein
VSVNFLQRRQFLRSLAGVALSPAGFTLLHSLQQLSASKPFPFTEVTGSGIHFVHSSGASPEKYLPESTGAGCAFLDYDNDGWMDIYLVNSGPCDFWTPPQPIRNALYRNNRDGTFTDVTEKAGVSGGGYGMGVAAGDYDRDGLPDLYVTQYGRSMLYHNNGDGTFSDVTQKAGVAAAGWSTSAVWFDYDNDGWLDLFVGRFADFSKLKHHACHAPNTPTLAGINEYCYPRIFDPMPSWLFHNNRDGTFTDVSQKLGISESAGKAWGVVAADFNNDGFVDLAVANDTVANFLFANRGGKKFDEIGFTAGVAYSSDGKARSGMGIDAADLDQDGWLDLFVTNLDHEFYALYKNRGKESFDDIAVASGMASATERMSGWGVKFFDFDNDGDLDLFIANGHPDDLINRINPNVTYSEPLLLFHNDGKRLQDISGASGPLFRRELSARGLALGDFDNDGAVDVLLSMNNGAPLLVKNTAGSGNHWLGVKLVGKQCNPDAVGAKITYQAGDLKRSRTKVGGGGFLSSHDPRVVLGLGPRTKIDWIEITWPRPSGAVQRFVNPPVDRYITITEGELRWQIMP